MAAGINILVNDGGAPARIIKVGNAAADINAGTMVGLTAAGLVVAENVSLPANSESIGVLFVDATSGDPASVLTGSGIICFLAAASGAIARGDPLSHDATGKAKLAIIANDECIAVALEAKGITHTGFVKAILR
jgi:hypothetical protein